jgi:signal recognition particle receptor subunit beta
VLLVIDHSTSNPAAELRHYQKMFERRRGEPRPLVVGVTRTDIAPHRPMSVYRDAVAKQKNYPLPVFAMDSRKPLDVRAALVTLMALLEMHGRFRSQRAGG